MHTFENLNIVLTRTLIAADAKDWVTTQALQGHSPGELKLAQWFRRNTNVLFKEIVDGRTDRRTMSATTDSEWSQ